MAILVSFMGALVVIKPGFAEFNLGILAILATAPLFAFSDLIAKELKAHHDDNLIIFSLSLGISALLLVPALYVWLPMTGSEWFGVFAIAVCATIGHVTLMRAFLGPDVGGAVRQICAACLRCRLWHCAVWRNTSVVNADWRAGRLFGRDLSSYPGKPTETGKATRSSSGVGIRNEPASWF